MCRYGLAEQLCEGREDSLSRRREVYDLLEMRAVYLNQAREPEEGTGLHLLHTLFSDSLSPETRAEILERNYSIVFTQEEKKMFDMFRFAEERGLEKGLEKGREEGEKIGLSKGEKIGLSKGKEIGLSEGKEIGLSEGRKEELDKNITNMIVFQLAENVSPNDIIRMLTNVFKISVAEAQRRIKSISAAMI